MGNMKTPGVYIVEKGTFPNEVMEAATSIPVFIGITEKASNGKDELKGKPWKISSMTEYLKYFGQKPEEKFVLRVKKKDDGIVPANCLFAYEADYRDTSEAKTAATYVFTACRKDPKRFILYYQMQMFFANGGGTCYVVSTGTYAENRLLDRDMVKKAIGALEKEPEITLVIIPEAVYSPDCHDIQVMSLSHCGKMNNRFAILDVQPKTADNQTMMEQIQLFQSGIGSDNLSYGAAYYPWLETTLLSDRQITFDMFEWDTDSESDFKAFFCEGSNMLTYVNAAISKMPDMKERERDEFHRAMSVNWPVYQQMVKKVKEYLNLLPPSASMAGIYTMVDNTRGVWKAPANVSVNYVNKPEININNREQEELNVPVSGKAINAIRYFIGEGIKVWGARTLDANSLDWRYINVRRNVLFLEESVKNAARAYVFEPNDANTWLNMKCMVENFLRGIWKKGGLAGATPEDAFSVHVGLGDTMMPEDILEGILRVTVQVAVSHPAEFIEITFCQQMQRC